MPFTETQPINIHDLAIETPDSKPAEWPDPFAYFDINLSDLEAMKKNGNILTIKLAFGEEVQLDQFDRAHFIKSYRDDFITSDTSLSKLSILAYYGHRQQLNEQDTNRLSSYFHASAREIVAKQNLENNAGLLRRMLGIQATVGPIEPTSKFYLFAKDYLKKVDPEKYLQSAAYLKLSGVRFESNHKDIENSLFHAVVKINTSSNILSDLLNIIAYMHIAASDEIIYGENGIELIKHSKRTNLNLTPPMPVVRNF